MESHFTWRCPGRFSIVTGPVLRYNAPMAAADADSGPAPGQGARFATTSWSIVVAARDADSGLAHEALATLCSTYWYPLYAYIRRHGHSPQEAEDLTQDFFACLVEKDFLASVDRSKGKFRSFLLAACGHFLANEHDRARAWKRGGRSTVVSFDFASAEARYGKEPFHTLTPEKLFARRWGLTLLDRVLTRLREDYVARNKGMLFDRLRVCLLGNQEKIPYAQVSQDLGMTPAALRVAVHRLRQQFQEVLRDEIGRTVDNPDQIEEEIRDLFACLGRERRNPL
jgi:RNA polymerase sigma factor (sigma-70 family)